MTSNKFWISHVKFKKWFFKFRILCFKCICSKSEKQHIWVYGNAFWKCVECFIKCTKWIWYVWFQYLCRYNVAKTKCMLCILKFTNRSHKFDVFREEFQEWKYGVSNSIIEFVEAFFSFLLISFICAQCSKVSSRNTNCDCRNKIRECQIRTRIRNLIFVLEDAKMNLGNHSTHSTIVF